VAAPENETPPHTLSASCGNSMSRKNGVLLRKLTNRSRLDFARRTPPQVCCESSICFKKNADGSPFHSLFLLWRAARVLELLKLSCKRPGNPSLGKESLEKREPGRAAWRFPASPMGRRRSYRAQDCSTSSWRPPKWRSRTLRC